VIEKPMITRRTIYVDPDKIDPDKRAGTFGSSGRCVEKFSLK
jgi:hypothetical protein